MKKIDIKLDKSQIKTRVTWGFNPIQRVVKSKKIYNRKRAKAEVHWS